MRRNDQIIMLCHVKYINLSHCISCYIYRLKSGDRIEVKWTINDEEDEETPPQEAALPPSEPKGVTVWWAAEIQGKTDNMHII